MKTDYGSKMMLASLWVGKVLKQAEMWVVSGREMPFESA
jgi:hypothetical protein